jgi:hypothetical protein
LEAALASSLEVYPLFAPWVHWGIEKKRSIRKDRESIIRNAQAMIVDYRSSDETFLPIGSLLKRNSNWIRIKPYLSSQALKRFDDAELEPLGHKKVYEAWDILEAELVRLRKEWKLV